MGGGRERERDRDRDRDSDRDGCGKTEKKAQRDPNPRARTPERNAKNQRLSHAWDATKVATAVTMGAVTVSPRAEDQASRIALPRERIGNTS